LLAVALLVLLQQVRVAPAQLDTWGWRIPFVIGPVISFAVQYLPQAMTEGVAFTQRRQMTPGRYLKAIAGHPRAIALVIGLTMGGTVALYTYAPICSASS